MKTFFFRGASQEDILGLAIFTYYLTILDFVRFYLVNLKCNYNMIQATFSLLTL